MRHTVAGWVLLVAVVSGCSSGNNIAARGKVVKGGQPFTLSEGEGMRIVFAPEASATGSSSYESFSAEYSGSDGTFVVRGKDGSGLPAGKYNVSLEWLKKKEDQFHGKYVGKKSPFKCEVVSGKDVVIDLDSGTVN